MPRTYVVLAVLIALALIAGGIVLTQRMGQDVATSRTQTMEEASESPEAQSPSVQSSEAATASPTVAQVKLTNDGFSPKTVRVKAGQSVVFTNESDTAMWVASDSHPSHNIYPAFDARKAYRKGEVYSFTFDKVGSWMYHNHLAATQTGIVVVE